MEVQISNFVYEPGGKWECGVLEFDAQTPLGQVTWREVVPGPRHGDDAGELEFRLNGHELSIYEPDGCTCWRDGFEFPDFEPPNKEGRDADRFASEGESEVAQLLGDWLERYREHPELLRVLSLPVAAG